MEGIEGVDYIRRSSAYRKPEDRTTEDLDEFASWIHEAYKDGHVHFASFRQAKVTAETEPIGAPVNKEERHSFNAWFDEVVGKDECKSVLKYDFTHDPKDETVEDYVTEQLEYIGEQIGNKLPDGCVKVEKNLLYVIDNSRVS